MTITMSRASDSHFGGPADVNGREGMPQPGAAADLAGLTHDASADPDRELRLDERAIWSGEELRWEHLVEVARELGPDPVFAALDDASLEADMRGQAARLAAETSRYLTLLAECVVRGIWADQGARTPAQWLSWAIGLGPSTAREHVRIALRLRELPAIRARFAAGSLSYSKVRALTRVAVPELEELLLTWADHATAAEIEQVVSGWRRSRRAVARSGEDPGAREGVEHRIDADGMMVITVRATPERGEELVHRLRRLVELDQAASAEAASQPHHPASAEAPSQPDGPASAEAPSQPHHPASAEAGALAGGLVDGPLWSVEATSPRGQPGERMVDALLDALATAASHDPGDATGADRHTLVLQVPAEALTSGDDPRPVVPVEGAGRRLPSMSSATLRRLACQAGVVVAVTDPQGLPIDVGRRQRSLTAALTRALRLRDRSCRFPGCTSARHLHAHHVVHWADGGPTDLANLVLVCAFHHRLVHERGWSVTPEGAGRFRFAPPDGKPRPRSLPLAASAEAATEAHTPDASAETSSEAHTGPDPFALQPVGWDGPGFVDYDMAVAVLHQELARALPDPAVAA